MPINLQGSGPITEGWGAAPTLTAPNLGAMVAAILQNKRLRDKDLTEGLAETIKNVRLERQGDAYTEQLKASGLIPKDSDIGGPFGVKGGHDVAELLLRKQKEEHEAQREKDVMDPYYKALTTRANRDPYDYGGGEAPPMPEPQRNQHGELMIPEIDRNGKIHWKLAPEWMQDKDDKDPTAASLKTEMSNIGITGEDIADDTRQFGSRGGERLSGDRPWTDADTIHITPKESPETNVPLSIEKFRRLKRALGYPDPDPTPAPSASPSANPDVTVGPRSTATPAPSGTPRPTATPRTTAQNYGVKGVYMRAPNGEESWVDPEKVEGFKRMGAVVIPAPRQ